VCWAQGLQVRLDTNLPYGIDYGGNGIILKGAYVALRNADTAAFTDHPIEFFYGQDPSPYSGHVVQPLDVDELDISVGL
jgi:hypothetical protein